MIAADATALLPSRQPVPTIPTRSSLSSPAKPWSEDDEAGSIEVRWSEIRERLSRVAWEVYKTLRGLANNHPLGWCWPSRAWLADKLRVTERTITRGIAALNFAGLVRNGFGGRGRAMSRRVFGRWGPQAKIALMPPEVVAWLAGTKPKAYGRPTGSKTKKRARQASKAPAAFASIEDVAEMVDDTPSKDASTENVEESCTHQPPTSPPTSRKWCPGSDGKCVPHSSKTIRVNKSTKSSLSPSERDSRRSRRLSLASLAKQPDPTEPSFRVRRIYPPDVKTVDERTYPIRNVPTKPEGEPFKPRPVDFLSKVLHIRRVSYPSPQYFAEDMKLKDMVEVMLKAYREAIRFVFKEPCFSYCKGDIERNSVYSALTHAAELLDAHEISPLVWAVNAVKHWKYEKGRGKKWPPIMWVFSPKRLDSCPSFGKFQPEKTNYRVPAFMKLMKLQHSINGKLHRVRTYEEYIAVVTASGVTVERVAELHDRTEWEYNLIEERLAEHAARGRWLWA